MKLRLAENFLLLGAVVLLAGAFAAAETLTGTVMNGTTGTPAAGDEVVLLTLSQGMNEAGRTKTDAKGQFSFNLTDTGGPHLVKVTHQGVSYFPAGGPIMPGSTSADVRVYDAAKTLQGISATVHLMRLQAESGTLQAIELIAVKNGSAPARTLMADRTWQIHLPEGAQIDQAIAQGPGGMPVNTEPLPDPKQKGRYYYVFPLRPGETRFQVAYHLPYSGQATIKPQVFGREEHFAVLMPKSMTFGAKAAGVYSPMADDTGQSSLEVATNVTPEKDLTFRVGGTGTLPADNQEASGGEQAQSGGMPGRPGGGLGNPEGTPDPLHSYRWPLLGACLAVLALGGFFVVTRSQAMGPGAPADAVSGAAESGNSSVFLQALKEELFQLELDRQRGSISDEEYAKAKAALDQTLQRAMARKRS